MSAFAHPLDPAFAAYVHGYSAAEAQRLARQAGILEAFIHEPVQLAPGCRVLEAGCGTGAQTLQLARRHPHARIVAVDRSADSLRVAEQRLRAEGLSNVEFLLADLQALPFEPGSFDAVFVCFVLEHLPAPQPVLAGLRHLLRPRGVLFAIEGDHGSVLAWPDDPAIGTLVRAVVRYQQLQGGDACIGRRLQGELRAAGFAEVAVQPCVAYADAAGPDWIEGFTEATFIAMMQGQRDAVLAQGLLDEAAWQAGIEALRRTTQADGSFAYTFFRATARR